MRFHETLFPECYRSFRWANRDAAEPERDMDFRDKQILFHFLE